ncbi:hypothetical protein ACJIZ3_018964 [Penstemon smallii]|uniref:Exostosin GT47 domain-containing protein n=1 Tax=Penstemon smallii TaxID=265156 RepID=A0ABD3SZT7_9LAMI
MAEVFMARRPMKDWCRGMFFVPIFTTSILFLVYISPTSKLLYDHPSLIPPLHDNPSLETSVEVQPKFFNPSFVIESVIKENISSSNRGLEESARVVSEIIPSASSVVISPDFGSSLSPEIRKVSSINETNNNIQNDDVFHDRSLFTKNYNEMNKILKIYTYPHSKTDPFANILLPVDYEPGGNYASESYFKKSLFKSHFLTNNPSEADLFYLPFSIASLRHDKRIGVGGIQDFVKNYIIDISGRYPFWNRSGGADHFYVACHSVGRTAMDKAVQVKLNAIQVVCSSNASVPQIWPRKGEPPIRLPSQRKKLAFYAGAMNSKVREFLVKIWKHDSDISVHQSRLKTPYSEALLGSKFCIHAKGFEVNTARIGDALYYGCVPVILADFYDLPFADILNWESFAVVLSTMDVPRLKEILQRKILSGEYLKLQSNVMRIQKHFQWHDLPVDYDAFYMVMYELWLRRSHNFITQMSTSSFYLLHHLLTRRRRDQNSQSPYTLKSLFFLMPTTLALATSLLILLYISSTSNLFSIHPHHLQLTHPSNSDSRNHEKPNKVSTFAPPNFVNFGENGHFSERGGVLGKTEVQSAPKNHMVSHGSGTYVTDKKPFHDNDIFLENYKEMNKTLKIYVYPHTQDDPFANVLLPVDFEPRGNYASESYFKKVLMTSHFITKDPSKADLFFLPFSIARLRHDPRVGINGIQDFVKDYIFNISHKYPYWNRSGGADHFYVACHSIGRSAMEKVVEVKLNAIQIVCSSNYYLSSYVAHKDASLPQIWPRQGDPPNLALERTKLVFFAGSINSPVREKLLQVWGNDSEISVHFGRINTSYSEELLTSKFCLHVKGYEVNTARIGDALYYGCVPVIIANHYDLPFQDILNWKSFSIVVATLDIPLLKKILREIRVEEYLILRNNVLKVREHFQWHSSAVDYDAFYLTMYELWVRRSSLRLES